MGIINTITHTVGKAFHDLGRSLNYSGGHEHRDIIYAESLNGFTYESHKHKKLLEDGIASNTDVFAIINRTITTAASIPLKIYKVGVDGELEEVTSGLIYDKLHNPNNKQNRFEFTQEALGYQLGTGNEIIMRDVAAGINIPLKLHVVPSDMVKIKNNSKDYFDPSLQYFFKYKGTTDRLDTDNLYHVRYFNPTYNGRNNYMGLSPLQAGYNTLVASNELMVAQSSALKNRGAMGMFSNDSDKPMTEEERDDLQKIIRDRIGGAKRFNGIVGTTAKVKFYPFGISPADLKMVESGVITMRQLCSLYGADSSNFNDPQNKKFNNLKEGLKSYYINAVLPPLERHVMGLNELIAKPFSKLDGKKYIIKIDKSSIEPLQEDQNRVVDKQVKLSKGITDVVIRVGEGKISQDSAINILTTSYDLTESEASVIVGSTNSQENE